MLREKQQRTDDFRNPTPDSAHEQNIKAKGRLILLAVMDTHGKEVFAVAILFFLLTWLTVGLRVYVRGYMLRTWGKDDWFMLTTVVSVLAFHRIVK